MKRLYPLLIIFAVVLLLFYPVFNTYFSQDDFFHFKISQTDGSLLGFIKLFGFYPFEERGIAFYRPIFRESFFNIFYSIFDLNHIPFRIFQFIIHFINISLVYIFIQKIFKKKLFSFFVAFFYGISASHIDTLYYLAGGIQSLGATTFIFLTLIFFINYLKTHKMKFKTLSLLTFLLALGSHELASILPLSLLGLIILYVSKKQFTSNFLQLWPYFLILFVYLYLDIFKIGFSSSEKQYQAILNPKMFLNSLSWYSLWALGLPEMLLDFVLPGLKLNPTLMRYWGNYFTVIFITFFISIAILGFMMVYLFIRRKDALLDKKFLFFITWFPLGLLPIIFLPAHKSTYYLSPVLPAFWVSVGLITFNTYNILAKNNARLASILTGIFLISTFILSFVSINLSHTTYWASTRGKIAQNLIIEVTSMYPKLPKGAAIYFKNDPNYPFVAKDWGGTSKQARIALNGADALQLLYKDFTLKVFYEDLGGIPEAFSKDKVFTLKAKIN